MVLLFGTIKHLFRELFPAQIFIDLSNTEWYLSKKGWCSPLTRRCMLGGDVYEALFLFGLAIVWESLTTRWKCSWANCVCEKEKENMGSPELCWRLYVKSVIFLTDADRSVYLRCMHWHDWLTEESDVVVLTPLLPGPHRHAGGCFHVFTPRCCLGFVNVLCVSCRSLKCTPTALYW